MRVNMLVADELVTKIDKEASKLCVTRTAYINMVLAQHFASRETVQAMPELLTDLKAVLDKVESLKSALPVDSKLVEK